VSLVDRYRGFVLDLDGTVYLGDSLLPGARRAVEAVREAGASILFMTNKPLEPSSAYAEKLTRLGLPTEPGEVISSLDSLVGYLGATHPRTRVLCVSEPLVAETLAGAGMTVVGLDEAESAEVVVVSFDRTFDYPKLHAAFRAVGAGAVIVASNPDRYCPTPEGGLPDCAAMLAAIEACTGAVAEAVLGKPSPQMVAAMLDRLGLPTEQVLIVGDRLETDVRMARESGVDVALVVSGVTTRDQALTADPAPTYVFDGLGDLTSAEYVPYESRR
jgi:NagD protein